MTYDLSHESLEGGRLQTLLCSIYDTLADMQAA